LHNLPLSLVRDVIFSTNRKVCRDPDMPLPQPDVISTVSAHGLAFIVHFWHEDKLCLLCVRSGFAVFALSLAGSLCVCLVFAFGHLDVVMKEVKAYQILKYWLTTVLVLGLLSVCFTFSWVRLKGFVFAFVMDDCFEFFCWQVFYIEFAQGSFVKLRSRVKSWFAVRLICVRLHYNWLSQLGFFAIDVVPHLIWKIEFTFVQFVANNGSRFYVDIKQHSN